VTDAPSPLQTFVKPVAICLNCWRAWLVGSRDSIGYCWHGKIAWRVKSGALRYPRGAPRDAGVRRRDGGNHTRAN
jgi:hypothetical protein